MKRGGTLAMLLVLGLPLCAYSDVDSLASNQARFGVSSGTVQLLSLGAADWIDAKEGVPLSVGDRIRTGDDGEVDLVMSQNVLWKLQPNSQLVAEHMEVNEGRFQLEEGSLLGKVDSAQASANQHWEFDTPMSICSIRGTEFAIAVPKPAETRLAVFSGDIEMQPAETASGEVDAVHVMGGQEGLSIRGKGVKVKRGFSVDIQPLLAKRKALEASLAQVQRTWSPFTDPIRLETRTKFVPAAPKRSVHPKTNRRVPAGDPNASS